MSFDKGINNRSNIGNRYYSNNKRRGERPKKKQGIHILIYLFVLGQWHAVLIGYGEWRRFSLSHHLPSHFLRIIYNFFSFLSPKGVYSHPTRKTPQEPVDPVESTRVDSLIKVTRSGNKLNLTTLLTFWQLKLIIGDLFIISLFSSYLTSILIAFDGYFPRPYVRRCLTFSGVGLLRWLIFDIKYTFRDAFGFARTNSHKCKHCRRLFDPERWINATKQINNKYLWFRRERERYM